MDSRQIAAAALMDVERDGSYSNLVQAWTLKQFPNINLLTGFRRVETMENSCQSLDLVLSDEDVALLSETAKPAQVKELDK